MRVSTAYRRSNPFVIAGLDPAIHSAEARSEECNARSDRMIDAEPGRPVDRRVKPGDDGFWGARAWADERTALA
jgi:hypothetical protein